MLDNLQGYVDQIISEHSIPASSVAVWKDGQLYTAASGILNLDTEVEANTDSIFQIGSITKVFTTSLIMKLVELGRVDLDKPVKHYLRSFEVADRSATQAITVRQLLNHTNGIAGDYFVDDQDEDGPHIARFIDRCSQLPLVHPVGDGISYSNVAFAIAGRLIEVVLGMSWFDAMEELIFTPLGMDSAICRPADVIRFRTAIGHLATVKDGKQSVHTCSGRYLCLGQSPAGTTPTMTAANLITFGRAHLDNGMSLSKERWLSEESIKLMQTPTVDIPPMSSLFTSKMGLGWMLGEHEESGLKFVSHSGGTNGQCAHLRIFPELNACFAILLNRSKSDALTSMINQLTQWTGGVEFDASLSNKEMFFDRETLESVTGHYRSYAGDYYVTLGDNGLEALFEDAVDEEEPSKVTLSAVSDRCFDLKNSEGGFAGRMHFSNRDDQGKPNRLFAGMRLYQRV